jgi:hypothetical protein
MGHDCLMQAWLFLHSVFVWQNCANPIVGEGMPGQLAPLAIVAQLVVAVIAWESASPQQTCPLGQSVAWRQLNTTLFGGHGCAEWGTHRVTKS